MADDVTRQEQDDSAPAELETNQLDDVAGGASIVIVRGTKTKGGLDLEGAE